MTDDQLRTASGMIRTPERIIPLSEVHYDPEHGLHMLTDCTKVHSDAEPAPAPIERTNPLWYPQILRHLAAHHPALSDELWATTIHHNTGHMGVLLQLAQNHPEINDQIWATVLQEARDA